MAGLILILSGCEFDGPRSVLNPAGRVAEIQLGLLTYTTWLSVIVLVAVFGALVYAIVKFRRRGNDNSIPNQTHGSVVMEAVWTIIPVIIVIMIAIPTVRAIFETETRYEPTEGDVVVNVMGYQWWWAFEYPELGIVTANELHFPVGSRVVLNVDSADVLHSFWVPRLGGKIDLIPGQDNRMWLEADEPGVYYGHCAELCLGAHAYMRFRVIVDTQEDYDAWVASFQAVQAPELMAADTVVPVQATTEDEQITQGQALFASKGCIGCHNVTGYFAEGQTTGSARFPDLTNYGLRLTLAAGVLPNTQENLEAWLSNPQAIKPGNRMPALWAADAANRDEEIAAVSAYLLSLGVSSPDTASVQGERLAHGGNQ